MRITALVFLLVLTISPAGASADIDAIRSLIANGRLDDALLQIDKVLAEDPAHRDARFLKGLTLARMDDVDGAISSFRAFIADFPELPEPYNNLAVLYASRGDYELAREALIAAINTHPSYAVAHENLGDLYAKMAADAYDQALALDQDNRTARAKLSLVGDLFSERSTPTTAPTDTSQASTLADSSATEPVPASQPMPIDRSEDTVAASAEPPPVQPEQTPATQTGQPVAPATAAPAFPSTSELADAQAAVRSWAAAWSNQDVEGYLDAYSERFRPGRGLSQSRWREQRRTRINRPEFIEVDVSGLGVTAESMDRVRAEFVQSYRSNTYSDRVRKSLVLVREGGTWKILEETSE